MRDLDRPRASGWVNRLCRAVTAPHVGALLLALSILVPAAASEAFISTGRPWPKRMRGTLVYTGDAAWVSADNALEFNEHYTVEFDVIFRLASVDRLIGRKTFATYANEYTACEVTRGDWYTVEWNFEAGCFGQQDGVHSGANSSMDPTFGGGTIAPAVRIGGQGVPRYSNWFAATPPGAFKVHLIEQDFCTGGVQEFDRPWGAMWVIQDRYRVRDSVLKVSVDKSWTEPSTPDPNMPTWFHTLKGTLKGLCRGTCP